MSSQDNVYNARYRERHRGEIRLRANAAQQAKRLRNRDNVRALKLLRGCFDCGYDTSADALEFDHRPGEIRLAQVATLYNSDTQLRAEIAKCDIVCSNCHSIRTAQRLRGVV